MLVKKRAREAVRVLLGTEEVLRTKNRKQRTLFVLALFEIQGLLTRI